MNEIDRNDAQSQTAGARSTEESPRGGGPARPRPGALGAGRLRPVSTPARRAVTVLGCVGAFLGVCAGVVQLVYGSSIPEWTGAKMDTTGLGLATIGLSLVAGGALWLLVRRAGLWTRAACVVVALACAVLCFTTVGRLWYVPGPLLIVAALGGVLAMLRPRPGEEAP